MPLETTGKIFNYKNPSHSQIAKQITWIIIFALLHSNENTLDLKSQLSSKRYFIFIRLRFLFDPIETFKCVALAKSAVEFCDTKIAWKVDKTEFFFYLRTNIFIFDFILGYR